MSRKFLIIVSSAFALGSLIVGGLYLLADRPPPTIYATDVSPGDKIHLPEAPPASALTQPVEPGVRLRLAIGSLGFADGEMDAQVSDLTLSELSGAPGLDIVDRQSLNKVLGELGLNLSGLVRANDAIRAGKLLHADWFLLGTRSKIAGTNSVVVRIVDARTGIMREAGVVTEGDSQTRLAGEIAQFVRSARQSAAAPKPRVYLAIGAFEDLSANNRLANFVGQLRGYLIAAYRGDSRVVLLEREYADTLLQELELDLAGLTEEGAGSPPQSMQSAFWLVDGAFQTYSGSNREVEVALNVQRMFGNSYQDSLHDAPGEPVDRRVKEMIDSALTQKAGTAFFSRRSEARAQVIKGREVAQLVELTFPDTFNSSDEQELGKQRRNYQEAIRAFKTALLLEPTNREAKVFLAACLRRRVIGRMDESRSYYRQVIEEPVQDRWTQNAQKALDWTFIWNSPEDKAAWFESTAGQTTDAAAGEYYNREAKAARLQSTLQRGGTGGRELAEERLFNSLTNNILRNTVGPSGDEEFLMAYGSDRTAAARRLAELYPALRARAPEELAPYMLAVVVGAQVDTNSPLIAEFQQMLDQYAKSPESIFRPQVFWVRLSHELVDWSYAQKLYRITADILEGKIQVAPHYSQPIYNEDRIFLAYTDFQLERWRQALDIFQAYSNAPLLMGTGGPWGGPRTVVFTDLEASYCREKLGLPAANNPLQFDLGKPFLASGNISTFTAGSDGLWIADKDQLSYVDLEGQIVRRMALPVSRPAPITAICAGPTNVWIATAGGGLFEFDKAAGTCRRFTVDDGLMENAVCSLCLSGDLLWIGYGYNSSPFDGGGLGNYNLSSRKFTSFVPSVYQLGSNPGAPTRRDVAHLAAGPEGKVWFSCGGYSLNCFRSAENKWEEDTHVHQCTGLLVGPQGLYVGQAWDRVGEGRPGIGISLPGLRDGNWRTFPSFPPLPDGMVTAIALDGDQLWVGGTGYLALLDTNANKVLRFAHVQAEEINRLQIAGNNLWAQVHGSLFRTPLGNLN